MNIVRKHTEQQISTSQTMSIVITKIAKAGFRAKPALKMKGSLRVFVTIVFHLKLSVLSKPQLGVRLA